MSSYCNVCRICLSVCREFMDIFEFAPAIMECAPIKILPGDGHPSVICEVCLDKLQAAQHFRVLCIQSDIILRQSNSVTTIGIPNHSDLDCDYDTNSLSSHEEQPDNKPEYTHFMSCEVDFEPEVLECDTIIIDDDSTDGVDPTAVVEIEDDRSPEANRTETVSNSSTFSTSNVATDEIENIECDDKENSEDSEPTEDPLQVSVTNPIASDCTTKKFSPKIALEEDSRPITVKNNETVQKELTEKEPKTTAASENQVKKFKCETIFQSTTKVLRNRQVNMNSIRKNLKQKTVVKQKLKTIPEKAALKPLKTVPITQNNDKTKTTRQLNSLVKRKLLQVPKVMYKCRKCGKKFPTKVRFRKHHKKLHPKIDHVKKCTICSRPFKERKSQTAQSQTNNNKDYCPYCCKVFSTRSLLWSDSKRHRIKYSCDKCDLTFKSKCHLLKHKQFHNTSVFRVLRSYSKNNTTRTK